MILVQLPSKGIHPQTIHYSMVGFEHVETNFVMESSEQVYSVQDKDGTDPRYQQGLTHWIHYVDVSACTWNIVSFFVEIHLKTGKSIHTKQRLPPWDVTPRSILPRPAEDTSACLRAAGIDPSDDFSGAMGPKELMVSPKKLHQQWPWICPVTL